MAIKKIIKKRRNEVKGSERDGQNHLGRRNKYLVKNR